MFTQVLLVLIVAALGVYLVDKFLDSKMPKIESFDENTAIKESSAPVIIGQPMEYGDQHVYILDSCLPRNEVIPENQKPKVKAKTVKKPSVKRANKKKAGK